jgi:hypothetical protein
MMGKFCRFCGKRIDGSNCDCQSIHQQRGGTADRLIDKRPQELVGARIVRGIVALRGGNDG